MMRPYDELEYNFFLVPCSGCECQEWTSQYGCVFDRSHDREAKEGPRMRINRYYREISFAISHQRR